MPSTPNPIAFLRNSVDYLSSLFNQKPKADPLQGSQYPTGIATAIALRQNLDIPDNPVRPIINMATSIKLIEINTWSYEAVHSYDYLARDCFQQQDGSSGSWQVAEELSDGTKVHPDVLAIAQDLQYRMDGDDLILGGDVLQSAVREMLAYGDSFLQFSWEEDGISRKEFGLSGSVFMPPFSMFVDRDSQGKLKGYWQQMALEKSDKDVYFRPEKILQFSYKRKKGQRYGIPIGLQSIDDWQKVKDAGFALAKAAMDLGVSPWIHELAEGRSDKDVDDYRRKHQNSLAAGGIVTNLYLLNGADVRKAAADSNAIAPLADYFLACRKRMIPPGVPTWLFPDLGNDAASNDLNGQPALAYARTIANLRSLLGQQIKRAIGLEIFLRRGLEFYQEFGQQFDIEWGDWTVSTLQAAMQPQDDEESGGNNKGVGKDGKGKAKGKDKKKPKSVSSDLGD